MRLIDADELKKTLSNKDIITWTHEYGDAIPLDWLMSTIDNAPTVEERPQGKWFDCIEAGTLKVRHGDYILYKVDYLLNNLTREVYIMEGARMRGKQ